MIDYNVVYAEEYGPIKRLEYEELEKFRIENEGKKYIVNRFKGLGELSLDETEEVLIDPDNRIVNQITVADVDTVNKLFDDLMGPAIAPRKNYIKEHSKEATFEI